MEKCAYLFPGDLIGIGVGVHAAGYTQTGGLRDILLHGYTDHWWICRNK